MGGGLSTSPTTTQQPIIQGGGVAPQFQPLAGQVTSAIGNQFENPGMGVSPLEQATIEGSYYGAQPAENLLTGEMSGSYLPGQANSNPYITSGLIQPIINTGQVEQRQLGAAAQQAGALNSTDFLNQSRLLSQNLGTQMDSTLANQYNIERGNQNSAVSSALGLGQYLLGAAAEPRQVATQATLLPYQEALQLLGPFAARNDVSGGQVTTGPSQASSDISGLSALVNIGTSIASLFA